MDLEISSSAITWFKDEIGVKEGEKVRFYPKFYGSSPMQEGYSLGFSKDDEPIQIHVSKEVDGILFYVEEDDIWFFNDHDLHVEYHEETDELEYKYPKH
ncbi:HesB/YadR/YfhF family protein [Fredinandcohnia humi]